MGKEKSEKYLTIYFDDNELVVVDVNDVNDIWKKILKCRDKIAKIETEEWEWNLVTNEITFH